MAIDVNSELDRIAKEAKVSPKLGDKRIKKSEARIAIEKFLEVDTDQLKLQAKHSAKKKFLSVIGDILIEFIDMIFHGRGGNIAKNVVSSVIRNSDNVSYRNYSAASQNRVRESSQSSKYTFSDLVFANRVDAVDLLDAMEQVLAEHGKVSVTNLYDILDDPSNLSMTDSNFGRYDLTPARVVSTGNAYRLLLPTVVELKD